MENKSSLETIVSDNWKKPEGYVSIAEVFNTILAAVFLVVHHFADMIRLLMFYDGIQLIK